MANVETITTTTPTRRKSRRHREKATCKFQCVFPSTEFDSATLATAACYIRLKACCEHCFPEDQTEIREIRFAVLPPKGHDDRKQLILPGAKNWLTVGYLRNGVSDEFQELVVPGIFARSWRIELKFLNCIPDCTELKVDVMFRGQQRVCSSSSGLFDCNDDGSVIPHVLTAQIQEYRFVPPSLIIRLSNHRLDSNAEIDDPTEEDDDHDDGLSRKRHELIKTRKRKSPL